MKKYALLLLFIGNTLSPLMAQTIETPVNTALTITSDMNLNSTKSIQVDGANYIKLPTNATGNTFMGFQAGAANTSGQLNVFMGKSAGNSNTSGTSNVFLGNESGFKNAGASNNLFIGNSAGHENVAGGDNLFFGSNAGYRTTSGFNIFIGSGSAFYNTTGTGNLFMGFNSGYLNQTGNNNMFLGSQSGYNNFDGYQNTFVGSNAGITNVGGLSNTYIGFQAQGAGANGASLANATAIGSGATVEVSNAVVLGNNLVNVGVRTPSPANTLHIGAAGVANTAGIRLPITSTASAVLNTTKFLTVNTNGDVVIGQLPPVREGVAESTSGMWETSGDNIVNTNAGGVVIGSGIAKTPVGYKLYVAGGMLTEKVKVALRNKSEWSDYVFEKGYKLAPLSEVSAFIKANGHLPGVPSADEMVNEGLDVAKMNAKLLEKVEELTLYMLNQQKQIQKLQNENKQIKRQINSRR